MAATRHITDEQGQPFFQEDGFSFIELEPNVTQGHVYVLQEDNALLMLEEGDGFLQLEEEWTPFADVTLRGRS